MLLLSSRDVHARYDKSFSHRRSSCCRLLDRSSRCRSFGEKKPSKLWIFPAVRDQRWWLRGGLYSRESAYSKISPPPQCRSCLPTAEKGGAYFREDTVYLWIQSINCMRQPFISSCRDTQAPNSHMIINS